MDRKPLTEPELAELARVQRLVQEGTHYDVLGLPGSTTREAVEEAYRAYVRVWHPDRFFNRDLDGALAQVDENFAGVTRAFRVLRDPQQRIAYDMELRTKGRALSSVAEPVDPAFETTFRRGSPAASTAAASPGAPAASPGSPASPARGRSPIDGVRQQLAGQLAQARRYFEAGKADFDAGSWSKAEGNLYLAARYDPQNAEYQALHREAVARGRRVRAVQAISMAESAEAYGQTKDAAAHYRRAVELDPPDGKAYFRLGQILRLQEDDIRAAVEMYRKAVAKEPRNIEYALVLAEVYDGLGLNENARRLAQLAAGVDREHAGVKALLKKLKL